MVSILQEEKKKKKVGRRKKKKQTVLSEVSLTPKDERGVVCLG